MHVAYNRTLSMSNARSLTQSPFIWGKGWRLGRAGRTPICYLGVSYHSFDLSEDYGVEPYRQKCLNLFKVQEEVFIDDLFCASTFNLPVHYSLKIKKHFNSLPAVLHSAERRKVNCFSPVRSAMKLNCAAKDERAKYPWMKVNDVSSFLVEQNFRMAVFISLILCDIAKVPTRRVERVPFGIEGTW